MMNCSQDCVNEFVDCLQFAIFDRDARRTAWLKESLISNTNLNAGTSASQTRSLTYLSSYLGELTWREKTTECNN